MNASMVSKIVLAVVLIAAVVSIVPTLNVGNKVQTSLDTEGLGDKRAPERIKALRNEYREAKPMLAIASIVSVILLFFFSKSIKLSAKIALTAILVVSALGFLYVEGEFGKAVDSAYANVMPLPAQMQEIAKAMPTEMNPQGADVTVLTTLDVTGQLSLKQREMTESMYPIMEDSINAVMGSSVIFVGLVTISLLGMLLCVFQANEGFTLVRSISVWIWHKRPAFFSK